MEEGTVAVVGATGFTGRLVVAALRGRGTPVRTIGRNRQKLEALAAAHPGVEVRAVEWTATDIADALRGCAAVVSCAGPFIQAGYPVAEAAVRARVPYTDSTGEQPFIRWVFDDLAQPARAAGVPLVPAAGFDYLPGDLGAALVARDMGPLERIDVVYAVESGSTTRGTRLSALGVAAGESMSLQDGRLQPMRMGSLRRAVEVPWGRVTGGLIPGGEPLQIPRHVDVATVHGYLALPGAMGPSSPGAGLVGSALRLPGAMRVVRRFARNGAEGPDEKQRQSRIAVHVQASARDGARRALLLEGRDVYGYTADALSELALRLGAGIDAIGPCAPAEVVDPAEFLATTGFSVREVSPEA
jgi:short subunit dehydrogenase-like uncharacterized protein